MAGRDKLGSPQYLLAWTSCAGGLRNTPQPGTGWSFSMVERDAKLLFDSMWRAADMTVMDCINVAQSHVAGEVANTLARIQAERQERGANG